MIRTMVVFILMVLIDFSVYAADTTKVEQLMKQEFTQCIDAQNSVTKIYDSLDDKNLETYAELPQIKQYQEALEVMISKCQKVYAFHDDVKQGEKIESLVGEAISKLESINATQSYCNNRFNFCVNYDENFGIEPAPDNGDGRRFYDRNGFKMSVFGSNNKMKKTLEDEIKFYSKNLDSVSYQKVHKEWGIVSGFKDKRVVYTKILKTDKAFNILVIEYPKELKEIYDSKVIDISASFKSNLTSINNIDSATQKIIFDKLNSYGDFREYGFHANNDATLKHVLKTVYEYPYHGEKHILVHAYSRPSKDFECHACSPHSSFFIFSAKNGKHTKWVLMESFINVLVDGQWGQPGTYKVVQIGKEQFGLISNSYGTGQGYSEGHQNIYIFEKNRIKNIFNVETSADDSGASDISLNSWTSSSIFSQDGDPFYNIVMKIHGIRDGKKFSDNVVYTYNGVEYVKSAQISSHSKNEK